MSTSEPVLSLAEAARACGVSVSTVRRRLTRLTEHGATRHATSWRIPISALVAEGMMPRVTPPDTSSHDTVTRSMTRHRDTPSDTSSQDLQEQLAEAEKRAAVAEAELRGARALVDEKQHTIDAQAHALRLLEPPRPALHPQAADLAARRDPEGNPWSEVAERAQQDESTKPTPARRPWWQRLMDSSGGSR
ncbi:winged helix-turn-helix domain-containing protein [Brachybacterium sp. JB7]|nr:winged helix-turn-helix domain-containing protein [Corynebacterium flavescens]RCS57804.1 winged helix-turn-helix domain-containing protein [Brachybacterium sp. JB7]RCS65411.1 winged helix-turn-helix domain-containing protein [Brachybacterium alimentarium]RCS83692.1 winged helix-turn-helix domain-containing protein [Brachybacterium alimentarium]